MEDSSDDNDEWTAGVGFGKVSGQAIGDRTAMSPAALPIKRSASAAGLDVSEEQTPV